MKIIFIRHGETIWNREFRMQGISDIELSEEGLNQAELLSNRFEKINIDKIYSSPLKRAYATAKKIADKKNMNIIKDDRITEINFGSWEGKSIYELEKECNEEFIKYFYHPEIANFPGEGNLHNVKKRALSFVNKLIEEDKDKNVAVVAHGGIIRMMIIALIDLDLSFFQKIAIDNTSLSIVETRINRNILSLLNDNSHLFL